MTIYWAGGEMSSFVPSDGSMYEETGGFFDNRYARCAMYMGGSPGSTLASEPYGYGTDYWIHFNLASSGGPNASYPMASFYNASGTEVYRLVASGLGNTEVTGFYWNGSAFVQVGAGFSFTNGQVSAFDFHLNSTRYEAYCAGTLVDSANATMTAVSQISRHTFYQANAYKYYSECIVADLPTLGYRLQTLAITANGDQQGWGSNVSPAYEAVNEIVYNDGIYIDTPTANEVSTFAQAATLVSTPSAVVVTARAAAGSTGPQHLQLALEPVGNSTVYFSGNMTLGSGFEPFVNVWPTNPNGNVAWTTAAVQDILYGVKSIA
jgi:hypothetical protein